MGAVEKCSVTNHDEENYEHHGETDVLDLREFDVEEEQVACELEYDLGRGQRLQSRHLRSLDRFESEALRAHVCEGKSDES